MFIYLKMYLLSCVLMSMLLMIADGFITLKGPSGPLVVPLGGSVVLPCSVDSLLPLKDLEVEWRRSDSQTLIHLYQDGDIRPEAQHQDYHDRAHFFTEDIKHGNFSLLLNNLTAEDEGQYTCKVHTGQESGETVVEIKHVERLIVSGSSHSVSASVGDDVILNCSVNSHIKPEEIEEVSWEKKDKDEDILVFLYQNNKTQSGSSDERYRDRVELFTDEIHRGNFSLRLKRVTTEDKGVYICQVFTKGLSANTTVILEGLGFSALHAIVLILSITASGSAVIICSLIYCTSRNKATVLHLQMCLVFCPNLIMFLAFIFWGVSEGSVNETVFCCALYILRPIMLLFAAPYINEFTEHNKWWLKYMSYRTEYTVFSTILYSVLFHSSLGKGLSFAGFEGVLMIILFGIVLLFCLFFIIFSLAKISGKISERITKIFRFLSWIFRDVLPSLQFILLFYMFGSAEGGFFIVAVLPVITTTTNYNWDVTCGQKMECSPLVRRSVWSAMMLLLTAVMMYFYVMALENEKDCVGWVCMIGFLQVLWIVWNCLGSHGDFEFIRFTAVYVFGSVGVVLISAVALIIELILKTG
ncbi:uncharacterized protein [Misgurnus anguillicaudatus]|uniref:uncharacterized protein n=1 Tax=Misgurnus anguillicaudatus TaxID=75329 RepID=UPI003CCF7F17